MGTIKQGILGGFSGKVAGVVGSSWKGIAVMKSLPLSVANPKTAGQVAQRTKFSNTVAFAGLILATIIKPLWDRFASQMSGYNDFIKTNIDLFAAALPVLAADLVISKGKMAKTIISLITATDASANVIIDWVDDSGAGFKLATDEAYAVVINVTQNNVGSIAAAAPRSDESTTVVMPHAVATGDVLECYLAFRRADGTIVSNTDHLQDTV